MSKVGARKSVSSFSRPHSVDHSNPLDSVVKVKVKPGRSSFSSSFGKANSKGSKYDQYREDQRGVNLGFVASTNEYKNGVPNSRGVESMSVQELEKYAVDRAKETTNRINDCLRIGEEIREGATGTLITLHHQGEQITRTHHTAASMEYELSRGEKLLGSLGGIFSRTWRPKKSKEIKGPVLMKDDSFKKRAAHVEQREKLGLSNPKERSSSQNFSSEPTSALEKVEREKAKQDDALSDLSNLLCELKEMAIDMGSEIEWQNKALDNLHDDVDELNFRVRGANARGRHLLRK